MSEVCSACVEDSYLKKLISATGEPGTCAVCHEQKKRTFSAEQLADRLAAAIRHNYAPGGQVPRFDPESDRPSWEQEGDSLEFIVQEMIGQYLGCESEIVNALIRSEHVDCADGEVAFFDSTQNYVETEPSTHQWAQGWKQVLTILKHQQRFFSTAAKEFFDKLFRDIDSIEYWDSKDNRSETVVRELSQGSELYRARSCDSASLLHDIEASPARHVGPPPRAKATAGRMNVAGVVVFYGAVDKETAIAELRPPLKGRTAVVKFRTTKTLRLLDFTRFESCMRPLSYFHRDFAAEVDRLAFLRGLGRLISKPIVPGNEAEYIITQTMAEYLALVHRKPFDGVLFHSAQQGSGVCIVLFEQSSFEDGWNSEYARFPVEVEGAAEIFRTDSISYKNRPVQSAAANKVLDFDPWLGEVEL